MSNDPVVREHGNVGVEMELDVGDSQPGTVYLSWEQTERLAMQLQQRLCARRLEAARLGERPHPTSEWFPRQEHFFERRITVGGKTEIVRMTYMIDGEPLGAAICFPDGRMFRMSLAEWVAMGAFAFENGTYSQAVLAAYQRQLVAGITGPAVEALTDLLRRIESWKQAPLPEPAVPPEPR